MRVPAIVPLFNEAKRIRETVCSVRRDVDEVIIVDDGSSVMVLPMLAEAWAGVMQLPHNQGCVAVIKKDFAEVSGDVIAIIDANSGFPTGAIPSLIGPVVRGEADVVQRTHNRVTCYLERFLTWLAWRIAPVGDSYTGLHPLRRDLTQSLEINKVCVAAYCPWRPGHKEGKS